MSFHLVGMLSEALPTFRRAKKSPRETCLSAKSRIFVLQIDEMMKKNLFSYLAVLLVGCNLGCVLAAYGSLPADLPSHYDLEGNYSDTMPKMVLLFYPIVSLVLVLLLGAAKRLLFRFFPKLNDVKGIRNKGFGLVQLCLAAIIFCSTCVTLTSGQCHAFFFAEPLFALLAIVAVIVSEARVRKAQRKG